MEPVEKTHHDHKTGILFVDPHLVGRIPRWTITIGVLLTGILYFFLPDELRIGPNWALLAIEFILILPIWLFWLSGHALPYKVVRVLSLILLGIVTLALAIGVFFLVNDLSAFKEGRKLFTSVGPLWIINILVFALWYWEIDGGGPRKRHEAGHKAADLLFPQQANGESWAPDFFDYLFVAFTAATAFSPTDTYPMTRTAKLLMMIQGLLSLLIVAILIGRAVNIF